MESEDIKLCVSKKECTYCAIKCQLSSQKKQIKQYLSNIKSITTLEATKILFMDDFRKRVSEMRRMGYPIADVRKKSEQGRSYKEYFFSC
jgi:hypothetical protein